MTEVGDGAELCFPELLNTSCRKSPFSSSEAVVFQFLLSSVSVLTVALNLLVIISVSHYRQLHQPTNLLLLSLSVSDFSVGLVVLPGEIVRNTACWFLGDFLCSLYKCIATITVTASVGTMVLISADRYVAICYPLHYPTKMTLKKVKICIILCWLSTVFYGSIMARDDPLTKLNYKACHGECVFLNSFIGYVSDMFVTFILPVSVVIVLYMRVFMVAVSQARAMRSHVKAVNLHHSVPLTPLKSELKAARTLGVLVVVFLICFCPFYCAAIVGDGSFTTSVIVFFLLIFNSCLNPLIYALLYPWFRKAVKHIVTLQILQPGSSEANIL